MNIFQFLGFQQNHIYSKITSGSESRFLKTKYIS